MTPYRKNASCLKKTFVMFLAIPYSFVCHVLKTVVNIASTSIDLISFHCIIHVKHLGIVELLHWPYGPGPKQNSVPSESSAVYPSFIAMALCTAKISQLKKRVQAPGPAHPYSKHTPIFKVFPDGLCAPALHAKVLKRFSFRYYI